ncbi:hypothetical protein [Vibrio agarivorans]|uniref:Uncharacterized protein n=1 Tax=Vibrio agarivorans TaxID=153622 RepID=A0ABT7Y6Y7_9VIBR|nr:hypothetical protein [Vibrio agarivorans]MDN2483821.1 hypothetical protein [Vibrio agarivorans]
MALLRQKKQKHTIDLTGPHGNSVSIISFIVQNSDYEKEDLFKKTYEEICSILINNFANVVDIIHDFSDAELESINEKIRLNTQKQKHLSDLLALL